MTVPASLKLLFHHRNILNRNYSGIQKLHLPIMINAAFIVFPIDIRTLYIKEIVELLHIEYQEDEKTTELCQFFPSKT